MYTDLSDDESFLAFENINRFVNVNRRDSGKLLQLSLKILYINLSIFSLKDQYRILHSDSV